MLEALNREFGIPDRVTFKQGHGGLTKLEITAPHSTGEIYLQGAHVTSFVPQGQPPLLWMSGESRFEAGVAIRGGVPICWPWFGPLEGDAHAPMHGFARLAEWTVSSVRATDDAIVVQLTLDRAALSAAGSGDLNAAASAWSADFELQLEVTFGNELTLTLTVSNTGDRDFRFAAALHTYFSLSSISEAVIKGLAGRRFFDKLDQTIKVQSGSIRIDKEVDRIYLGTEDEVVIEQPDRPDIFIGKQGSQTTVIWNPWVEKAARMADFPDDGYLRMVCVETANADQDSRQLSPGERHQLTQVSGYLHQR
ncbi:MAG: D-hexose-6-phosphate mutarotase [Planctomycetales bacterium]|nr:D-hexose-6-phosphate mutarotase [Planctomycetales bacterium]